jgi:hypothetical protein
MPTAKEIAANRLNSQKATGPRTIPGKAASRFPSLKHRIFAIHQIVFDDFRVDTLIHNEPSLLRRVEAELCDPFHTNLLVKNIEVTPSPSIANPRAPPPERASQPQHFKPISANLVSFRQNPQPPAPAAPNRGPAYPRKFSGKRAKSSNGFPTAIEALHRARRAISNPILNQSVIPITLRHSGSSEDLSEMSRKCLPALHPFAAGRPN